MKLLRYWPLVLALPALADNLDDGSLLERYGVDSRELPAGRHAAPIQDRAPAAFHLQADGPVVDVKFADPRAEPKPGVVDNPLAVPRLGGICEHARRQVRKDGGFNDLQCP